MWEAEAEGQRDHEFKTSLGNREKSVCKIEIESVAQVYNPNYLED
jgi:hypothetical protein